MKKSILVSLGYLGISLLIIFLSREIVGDAINPATHSDVVKSNVIMYLISLIGLIYLLVAVMIKRREYPALIIFVILVVVSSLNNFLAITLGSQVLEFMFLSLLFQIILFFAHFVIAVLMIYKNAWPVIVSIVIFLKLPGFLLSLGVDRIMIQYLLRTQESVYVYGIYSNIYMSIGLIATTIMLFVLYYEKEDEMTY